jgi:hypothetical protein
MMSVPVLGTVLRHLNLHLEEFLLILIDGEQLDIRKIDPEYYTICAPFYAFRMF